jgi:hypothetical protein
VYNAQNLFYFILKVCIEQFLIEEKFNIIIDLLHKYKSTRLVNKDLNIMICNKIYNFYLLLHKLLTKVYKIIIQSIIF